jgi:hypothetical protein
MYVTLDSFSRTASTIPNDRSDVTWEWRVFWRDPSSPIRGLSDIVLPGRRAVRVVRERCDDTYFLLPSNEINLKIRGGSVTVKPLSARSGPFNGYSHKRAFLFPITGQCLSSWTGLPIGRAARDVDQLRQVLRHHVATGKIIDVRKSRHKVTLVSRGDRHDHPGKIGAEFATVLVGQTWFTTLCLRSKRKEELTRALERIDVGSGRIMDYVAFLALVTR